MIEGKFLKNDPRDQYYGLFILKDGSEFMIPRVKYINLFTKYKDELYGDVSISKIMEYEKEYKKTL